MKEVKLINCLVNEGTGVTLLNPKDELESLKEAFHYSPKEFVSNDAWTSHADEKDRKVQDCSSKYSGATSDDVVIESNMGMIPFIVVMDGKILAVAGKAAREVVFKTSKGNIKGVTTHNFIYKGIVAIRKNPQNESIEEIGESKHDFFNAVERFESGIFSSRVKDLSGIEIDQLPSKEYRLWVYGPYSHFNGVMVRNGDHADEEYYTPNIDQYAMCQINKAKSPASGHGPMSAAVGRVIGAHGNRIKYFLLDNTGRWVETSYPEMNYKLLGNSGVMDAVVERKFIVKADDENEKDHVELKSVYCKEALEAVERKYRRFCMNTDVVDATIFDNVEGGVSFTRLGGNFPNKAKEALSAAAFIKHISASQKEKSANGLLIEYTFEMDECMEKYNIEYRVKYDMDCLNLRSGTYSENKPVLDAKVEGNTLVLTIHAHKSERNSEMRVKQLFN